MAKKFLIYLICLLSFYTTQSFARIEDSVICLDAALRIEKEFNIPPYVLSAIALTETGKKKDLEGQAVFTPTPWAINIEGKGHYFSSKADAMIKVKKALARGKKSIDGCMQINLKYHGDAFETLSDAFDPYLNMRYAAEFVTSLHRRLKNWKKAVAHYHSATPHLGAPYSDKVEKNWKKAVHLMQPSHIIFSSLQMNEKKAEPRKISQKERYYQERMKKIAQLRAEVRQNTQE